jgi:hypothetical protein
MFVFVSTWGGCSKCFKEEVLDLSEERSRLPVEESRRRSVLVDQLLEDVVRILDLLAALENKVSRIFINDSNFFSTGIVAHVFVLPMPG